MGSVVGPLVEMKEQEKKTLVAVRRHKAKKQVARGNELDGLEERAARP